jgi:DNA-directed RNA polymerase specialized sigma24 family protein
MTATTIQSLFRQPEEVQSQSPGPEQPDEFSGWFSRCRNTLHFMADLILDSTEEAERAVENCWHKASGNAPSFEKECDFRGWIFRLLIDEALSMSRGRY